VIPPQYHKRLNKSMRAGQKSAIAVMASPFQPFRTAARPLLASLCKLKQVNGG